MYSKRKHLACSLLGMVQGIPHSLFPEVLDLFSLSDFLTNRFYHSSAPRGPRQNLPRSTKRNENFQKFVEICLFSFLFFRITNQFWVLLFRTLKHKFNAVNSFLIFFQNFFDFGGLSTVS